MLLYYRKDIIEFVFIISFFNFLLVAAVVIISAEPTPRKVDIYVLLYRITHFTLLTHRIRYAALETI
jgi:hypothetical protein